MDQALDSIWILDSDEEATKRYHQALSPYYSLQIFAGRMEFVSALARTSEPPKLLIVDPVVFKNALADILNANREVAPGLQLPATIITTHLDDLEMMRFYLKTGVRDYLLKPVSINELIAKVERALMQMSNREVLIMRDILDGREITDLTFREHQLLTIFLSREDRSVSRDELYHAVWSKVTVNPKTLDVHLFNLRRKLRKHGYDICCTRQIFKLLPTPANKNSGHPAPSWDAGTTRP